MSTQHNHDSFTHCCPVCGLAPRQIQPDTVFGFEKRTCTRCGEEKGGNPYRWCRCMREEEGIDHQPHKPPQTPRSARETTT